MKKTTFVLSALALATSSAQAYTLVDHEATGTKVDFNGSARLVWRSTANKTETNGNVTRNHINHAVANNGSRFGFKITQQIADGFYGLGRVEWRFRGTSRSQHDFDDLYTRQLYAGIGHKQYGELTYGHQTVITDSVKQTDLGNTLSLSDGLLVSAARKSLQYTYKGIEGLTAGVFYGDQSKRNNNAVTLNTPRKDVWGIGGIYQHKLDEMQKITVGLGASRERHTNLDHSTARRVAYSLGTAYTVGKTTLGLDLERSTTRDHLVAGTKRTNREVRSVLNQQLTDDWRVYTMYAYKTDKLANAAGDSKAKKHQYMVGTEYFIVPKYLKGFVEWQTNHTKKYSNGVKTAKVRDNVTAIGLRAYW